MKYLIFFIPFVTAYNNYFMVNKGHLLVCANETTQVININWFEGNNGIFENMSYFFQKLSTETCPSIYYCEYEELYGEYYIKSTDLFRIKCPFLKESS